jgi:hypothetical protein
MAVELQDIFQQFDPLYRKDPAGASDDHPTNPTNGPEIRT